MTAVVTIGVVWSSSLLHVEWCLMTGGFGCIFMFDHLIVASDNRHATLVTVQKRYVLYRHDICGKLIAQISKYVDRSTALLPHDRPTNSYFSTYGVYRGYI